MKKALFLIAMFTMLFSCTETKSVLKKVSNKLSDTTSTVKIIIPNSDEFAATEYYEFEGTLNGKPLIIGESAMPMQEMIIGLGTLDLQVHAYDAHEQVIASGRTTANIKNKTELIQVVLSSGASNSGTCLPPIFAKPEGAYSSSTALVLTMTTKTDGATIYYTLDNTPPTTSSLVYTTANPPQLSSLGTYTVQAIAAKSGMTTSSITKAIYQIINQEVVQPVTFTPEGGTYNSDSQAIQNGVSLSCATSGATIRYTTNGNEPNENSDMYSSNIELAIGSTTIKAKAFKANTTSSPTAVQEYKVLSRTVQMVATPTISDNASGGSYTTTTKFTLACTTPGATIYYTTNGDSPKKTQGTKYTAPFSINEEGTFDIKARAFVDEYIDSAILTKEVTIAAGSIPTVSTPVISFNGSSPYTKDTTISIECSTSDAEIYYTTNGNEPTKSSNRYISSFKLTTDGAYTVKAKAFKAGMSDSQVASKGITISTPYDGVTIYYKANSTPTIWLWQIDPDWETFKKMGLNWDTQPSMTAVSGVSGWYKYDIPSDKLGTGNIKVIFNKQGGGTERGSCTTGWFDGTKWTDENPDKPALPTIIATPNGGAFETTQEVALSVDGGYSIYYTLDGSTPSLSSTKYTQTITLTASTVIKAMITDGSQTSMASFSFMKQGPQAPAVTANPGSKSFSADSISVSLTVSPTTTIYYTIDGSTPSKTSSSYSTALTFTDTTTLKTYVEKDGLSEVKTFTYTKTEAIESQFYQTNPNGQVGKYKTGMNVTCVSTMSDGFSDWSADCLIAQGVANDDARAFKGGHEYPVYDSYSLYAAWDDTNLYLGWQFVYVNDVVDPANNGGNEAKPTNGDIPQMIVFDLDPNKTSDGLMAVGYEPWANATGPYKKFDTSLGVDTILMFSSKGGVGTPGYFTLDSAGKFSYEDAVCQTFSKLGIVYGAIHGNIHDEVWGVNASSWDPSYTPESLLTRTDFVEMIAKGHDTKFDTFYEMKIPFAALGITKSELESRGIGVMHISTFGLSAIASIPFDMCTVDNAKEEYSADPSSSYEKEDLDIFTTPLARIGKL